MILFNKTLATSERPAGLPRGKGLPSPVSKDIYMELTVEEAIFCIMVQTVIKPIPSNRFHNTRSIQKQLKTWGGVEVTLRHIRRIFKRWRESEVFVEIDRPLRLQVPIHGARTICYQVKHPEKIFTVKKWKRKNKRK